MKWCIPAFATSLVVFLLLFAAIDLRRTPANTHAGSMIERRAGDAGVPDEERTGPAARGRETTDPTPRATQVPPPARASGRELPAAVALIFEQRLEEELLGPLRERRATWFDRKQFSRASPRVPQFDFTRIELPPDAAEIADAALRIRREGRARLLLIRVGGAEAPIEVAMAGAEWVWGSAEEFVRGFPGSWERLPAAPEEAKRLRLSGPYYDRMQAAEVKVPLDELAEKLRFRSLISRSFPSDASFAVRRIDDASEWPANSDGLFELSAPDVSDGRSIQVPLRYDVDQGAMHIFFAGEWRSAWECIPKIVAKRSFVNVEGDDHPLGSHSTSLHLRAEWVLES